MSLALNELDQSLHGLPIRDVAQLRDREDLLLFFRSEDEARPKSAALHVAIGRDRARVCTTTRRWPKEAWATSPRIDRLRQALIGKRFAGSAQAEGEQRCKISFTNGKEILHLEVELFGSRGFWTLTTESGEMLVLSRLARRAGQTMQSGDPYQPPGSFNATRPRLPSRFPTPVLAKIDRAFTDIDLEEESNRTLNQACKRLAKEIQKLTTQVSGLEQQRLAMLDAEGIRQKADLLLAFGFSADKSARELLVDDPKRAGEQIRIPLQPGRSIQEQADRIYKKARKYEDGLPRCEERLALLQGRLQELQLGLKRIQEGESMSASAIQEQLVDLGLAASAAPSKPEEARIRKITRGENLRRAISAEGYLILIGRNNRQNDKLSTSLARGNDLWFHIGRGRAGSHVVLRLPKGKTASLESLLDAGTLAVHFSKSRAEPIAEVIYTQAKNVSKPKGLAPGKVLADHVKALRVDLDPMRLKRLLDSAEESQQA
ncbi:MAG: NFACT RNA binding domain-containing protein [Planctomycetota bacterium]